MGNENDNQPVNQTRIDAAKLLLDGEVVQLGDGPDHPATIALRKLMEAQPPYHEPDGVVIDVRDLNPPPVYRIKPLAWNQSGRAYPHWEAVVGGIICTVWKELHNSFYYWNVEQEDGSYRRDGAESEINTAKLAAEAAYRKLIAEHLEVVE